MKIPDRKRKILAAGLLSLLFLWSVSVSWIDSVSRTVGGEANRLSEKLLEQELFILEVHPRLAPSSRRERLAVLSERFRFDAAGGQDRPILHAEGLILAAEAAGTGDRPPRRADLDAIEQTDPRLYELMMQLYEDGQAPPDISLFLDRMGRTWFSLTALTHYADRVGDRTMRKQFERERYRLAKTSTGRLGLLSLVLAAILSAGVFIWIRFLMNPGRYPPVAERILPLARWNSLDGILVFMLFFWTVMLLSYLLGPAVDLMERWGVPRGLTVVPLYVLQAGVGLFLMRLLFFRLSWPRMLGTMGLLPGERSPAEMLRWGVGGYAATMPVVAGVLYLSSRVFHTAPVTENPLLPMLAEGSSIPEQILLFVTLALLGPVFEEIFFRGFLFNTFRAGLGAPAGMVLSALFFALVHFDFSVFFGLFAIGMMLSFVYLRTQSLVPPMILHALWNTTTFLTVQVLF